MLHGRPAFRQPLQPVWRALLVVLPLLKRAAMAQLLSEWSDLVEMLCNALQQPAGLAWAAIGCLERIVSIMGAQVSCCTKIFLGAAGSMCDVWSRLFSCLQHKTDNLRQKRCSHCLRFGQRCSACTSVRRPQTLSCTRNPLTKQRRSTIQLHALDVKSRDPGDACPSGHIAVSIPVPACSCGSSPRWHPLC